MPYIKSGQWQVPSRKSSPAIVVEHCAICGAFVPEPDRHYQDRLTGVGASALQRWTFCPQHVPKKGLREEGLPNRTSLEM